MTHNTLKHKLKNRHLQMIALGAAVGTGLFFGSAKSIHLTGPSIILSYILGGIIIYIIMRALGEMTVDNPNSGAFSEYASQYIGPYAGFISGWSAWFEYTVVCMVELTAVTIFFDYWIPSTSHWLLCLTILIFFTGINLFSVKMFGEFEFWFAGIKILAIILMIVFSAYLIFFKNGLNPEIKQYSNVNLLFAGGINGFLMSLVIVIFSYGGTEFVSIAAAEAENPKRNVPKAINGVIYRIILFYVLTMLVIILLYPYQKLATNISPFVDVYTKIGIHLAASIMNIVAITVALSAFNSLLYSGSRILFNMSVRGYAPQFLSKVTKKNHIPKNAILSTSFVISIGVFINYLYPSNAIMYLLTIATGAILIMWFIILLTQFYFRKYKAHDIAKIDYKSLLFPYSNLFAMSMLFLVAGVMMSMENMKLCVYVAPLWVFILSIFYFFTKKKRII